MPHYVCCVVATDDTVDTAIVDFKVITAAYIEMSSIYTINLDSLDLLDRSKS